MAQVDSAAFMCCCSIQHGDIALTVLPNKALPATLTVYIQYLLTVLAPVKPFTINDSRYFSTQTINWTFFQNDVSCSDSSLQQCLSLYKLYEHPSVTWKAHGFPIDFQWATGYHPASGSNRIDRGVKLGTRSQQVSVILANTHSHCTQQCEFSVTSPYSNYLF